MKPSDFTKDAAYWNLSLVGPQLHIKHVDYRKRADLPARTRRNIAVCSAVGLTWWSEHPETGGLWATDFEGGFHELQVSEKYKTVKHVCGDWNNTQTVRSLKTHDIHLKPCTISGPTVGWDMPVDSDSALTLLADDGVPAAGSDFAGGAAEELGPTVHCSAGRHDRCKYRAGAELHGGIAITGGGHYACPCDCHAVERERAAERQDEQERIKSAIEEHGLIPVSDLVAIRMIERDPACIGGLHVDYLRGALGHTDYDDRITAELTRRLGTEAAS